VHHPFYVPQVTTVPEEKCQGEPEQEKKKSSPVLDVDKVEQKCKSVSVPVSRTKVEN
jgi:hypothetical protein